MLGGERVVLDRVECRADRGILGALEHGPQSQIVAASGGEGDSVELGGGVQVGGHGLGECPRAAVLERGLVEVVQVQQMGERYQLRPRRRDGLGRRHGAEAAGQRGAGS